MVSVAAPQILTPATPLLDHWKATEICGFQLVPKNDHLSSRKMANCSSQICTSMGIMPSASQVVKKKSHQAVAHRLNIRCSANAHDLS